jgi:hypothetical protein
MCEFFRGKLRPMGRAFEPSRLHGGPFPGPLAQADMRRAVGALFRLFRSVNLAASRSQIMSLARQHFARELRNDDVSVFD